MRKTKKTNNLKVQAISGTYVVFLGFNLPESECENLLGFSIHRSDNNKEAYYLTGMKTFKETNPGFPPGSVYSTEFHPIQDFQWADYSAKPGVKYTYTVSALKGTPKDIQTYAETKVSIITESPESNIHEVYFNRGIAASQEYERRFGNVNPTLSPNSGVIQKWLSRGLYEALEKYISETNKNHSLRIAAYEFHYEPLLNLIKETIDRGVDIKIVFDYRKAQGPKEKNKKAVLKAGLKPYCTERTEGKSYISHNKFIVKLELGEPISVWTGGTNFSESGIFGHSNVAHIVKDKTISKDFLKYWSYLDSDLTVSELKNKILEYNKLPDINNIPELSSVFSPRPKSSNSMNLYTNLALSSRKGLFITFAFGINAVFKEVYKNSLSKLRFALLEKKTRPMKTGSPERLAEEKSIDILRFDKKNIFAIGTLIKTANKLEGWVKENLTGLNRNVKYIHNKFMLIDPLSNNPIVIVGSANFSDASTFKNDENMIIIKGNTQVADIYFGEYMRLFNHHSFRESINNGWINKDKSIRYLKDNTDKVKWWEDHFGDTVRSSERKYFSKSAK